MSVNPGELWPAIGIPMPYEVRFTPAAINDLRTQRTSDATRIVEQCRRYLSVNPTLASKARIKRLRGGVFPPFRLRVGEYRVFYDVREEDKVVIVHAVSTKERSQAWLDLFQSGERSDETSEC